MVYDCFIALVKDNEVIASLITTTLQGSTDVDGKSRIINYCKRLLLDIFIEIWVLHRKGGSYKSYCIEERWSNGIYCTERPYKCVTLKEFITHLFKNFVLSPHGKYYLILALRESNNFLGVKIFLFSCTEVCNTCLFRLFWLQLAIGHQSKQYHFINNWPMTEPDCTSDYLNYINSQLTYS